MTCCEEMKEQLEKNITYDENYKSWYIELGDLEYMVSIDIDYCPFCGVKLE